MYCYQGEIKFRGSGISTNLKRGFYKFTYLDIGEHRIKSVTMHQLLSDILDQSMGKKVTIWGKKRFFMNMVFAVEVDGHRESMPFIAFVGTMVQYHFFYIPLILFAAAIGASVVSRGFLLALPVALWVLYDIFASLRLYLSPQRP